MSGENNNKDKPPSSVASGLHRPAPIQHTQPGQWPAMGLASISPADYNHQWQQFWQWQQAMAAYQNPAYQQQMAFLQQQQAAAASAAPPTAGATSTTTTLASPRGKDDSVKVVKPKDPHVKAVQTPAGIQSPKPNSPGFLLGAGGGKGGSFRAFSPYTSRSDTPGGTLIATGLTLTAGGGIGQSEMSTGCMPAFPQTFPPAAGVFDYYIIECHGDSAALPPTAHNGVDLTKSAASSKKSRGRSKAAKAAAAATAVPSSVAPEDKKEDPHRPVGIVKARHRTPADRRHGSDVPKSDADGTIANVPSSSSDTVTASAVTTSSTVIASQQTASSVSVSVANNAWTAQPSFHPALPAYMAAPYQPFALAQPTMYMMPAHRPMFPGQPPAVHPGYLPVGPQPLINMPELTVKTSQHQQLVTAQNASTSPNKPLSAASSPKQTNNPHDVNPSSVLVPMSPLDKFREKLNDKNSHKSAVGTSRQPSPTNSEAKSISSESTEKLTEGGPEKSNQTSVIIQPPQQGVLLKPAPTKRERKEKSNTANKNKTCALDKGPKAKVRKTASKGLPSNPMQQQNNLTTVPTNPIVPAPAESKPLIAPAKLKLDTPPTLSEDPKLTPVAVTTTTTGLFATPALLQTKKSTPENLTRQSLDKPPPRSSPEKATTRTKRSSSRDSADKLAQKGRKSQSVERRSSRERTISTPRSSAMADSKLMTALGDSEKRAADKELGQDSTVHSAVTAAKPTKQMRSQKPKRKSTDSGDKKMEAKAEVEAMAAPPSVIPTNVENKPYLWAEDALDPVIVKHSQQAYDICQDEDLKQLEMSLKARLKTLDKQIESHEGYLKDESLILTLHRSLSASSESRSSLRSPTSPDKPKSCFSVRSDSHPSLKMKAAAKAKSRASQSEDMETGEAEPVKQEAVTVERPAVVERPVAVERRAVVERPVAVEKPAAVKSKKRTTKAKQVIAPLAPISIPGSGVECKKLTKQELLSTDGLILTCIDGLFYESRIKPIEPPDIYGVVIDGERHSKPRIFTEEELLSNTFSNLTPLHLTQLDVETRVCAYWSDMIGCLYPGKVTALYPSAGTNSKHLIDIEFDDGDSGKFPLYQIRLLPYDYPHVDYDATNVIPVGRRRRSTVPETPPIMTTPPSDRSRLSQSSLPRDSTQYQMGKKRGRPTKEKAAPAEPESEVFDQSTDDELMDGDVLAVARWEWVGTCTKRQARGRGSKEYYQSIARDGEVIKIGDCAVFKSVGGPATLPYIGQVQSMWEGWGGKMVVNVKWFYHPEELEEVRVSLPKYKGALFHSEHIDENDIQTISHKCEVVSYEDYLKRKLHLRSGEDRMNFSAFYLAGNYDAGRRKVKCVYV